MGTRKMRGGRKWGSEEKDRRKGLAMGRMQ